MNNEKAKYVIREIRSIWRYDIIINSINKNLERISSEIESVLGPSCPNDPDSLKIKGSILKQTIVNSLISDEQELIKERRKFENLRNEAYSYRVKFMSILEPEEEALGKEFVKGTSYKQLENIFGYSNAYDHILRISKRLKF